MSLHLFDKGSFCIGCRLLDLSCTDDAADVVDFDWSDTSSDTDCTGRLCTDWAR